MSSPLELPNPSEAKSAILIFLPEDGQNRYLGFSFDLGTDFAPLTWQDSDKLMLLYFDQPLDVLGVPKATIELSVGNVSDTNLNFHSLPSSLANYVSGGSLPLDWKECSERGSNPCPQNPLGLLVRSFSTSLCLDEGGCIPAEGSFCERPCQSSASARPTPPLAPQFECQGDWRSVAVEGLDISACAPPMTSAPQAQCPPGQWWQYGQENCTPQNFSCGWPPAPSGASVAYVQPGAVGGAGTKASPYGSFESVGNVDVVFVGAGAISVDSLTPERPQSVVGLCPEQTTLSFQNSTPTFEAELHLSNLRIEGVSRWRTSTVTVSNAVFQDQISAIDSRFEIEQSSLKGSPNALMQDGGHTALREVSLDVPLNGLSCSNGALNLQRVTLFGVPNENQQPTGLIGRDCEITLRSVSIASAPYVGMDIQEGELQMEDVGIWNTPHDAVRLERKKNATTPYRIDRLWIENAGQSGLAIKGADAIVQDYRALLIERNALKLDPFDDAPDRVDLQVNRAWFTTVSGTALKIEPNARALGLRNLLIDQRALHPQAKVDDDPTGLEFKEGARASVDQALIVTARDIGFLAERASFTAENLRVVVDAVPDKKPQGAIVLDCLKNGPSSLKQIEVSTSQTTPGVLLRPKSEGDCTPVSIEHLSVRGADAEPLVSGIVVGPDIQLDLMNFELSDLGVGIDLCGADVVDETRNIPVFRASLGRVFRVRTGYRYSARALLDEALRGVLFEDNRTNLIQSCN